MRSFLLVIVASAIIVTGSATAIDELIDQTSIDKNTDILKKGDVDGAVALLKFADNERLAPYAADALQRLVSSNPKLSYAWHKWQEEQLQRNDLTAGNKKLLQNLRTLEVCIKRDRSGQITSIMTCYRLTDGRKIPHGIFLRFASSGPLKEMGTFCHGLRHGRFIEWIGDKERCNAEWRNGIAWEGTVETTILRDRVIVEVKDGKAVSLAESIIVSEPRLWFDSDY